jgi:hypothetical protein
MARALMGSCGPANPPADGGIRRETASAAACAAAGAAYAGAMRALAALLLLLLVAAADLRAADEPTADVAAARLALKRGLAQAAQQILKATQDGVVAMADLRPAAESEDGSDHAAALQKSALVPALLREGVLLLPFEGDHPVTVTYKNGKLPAGILLGPEDGKYVIGRGARFLIVPQLIERKDVFSIALDLYDLSKGAKSLTTGVGGLSTKKVGIDDAAPIDALPARNVAVLLFAVAHFGEQVDRGECWDLAAHPVRENGGDVQGYVFGTEVPWERALPGDVVTFGTSGESGGHVTVLFRLGKTRADATILHQNYNGIRKVGLGSLGAVEGGKAGQRLAVWRP